MTKKITHAVIPIAGLGTRCLPASKSIPKEMLCVGDRPIIQHIFEKVRDAGIEHFIFVTGREKSIIENHFDHAFELETQLQKSGKNHQIENLHNMMARTGEIIYTRQQKPLGLGHAVACAHHWLPEDSSFLVVLPDMLFSHETQLIRNMITLYETNQANVIAVKEVPLEETEKYGIVTPQNQGNMPTSDSDSFLINHAVEKPTPQNAPSRYAILGRYILSTQIFNLLDKTTHGALGEIQLTDALNALIGKHTSYALPYKQNIFDCGSIEGLMAANMDWIYNHKNISDTVKKHYGLSIYKDS